MTLLMDYYDSNETGTHHYFYARVVEDLDTKSSPHSRVKASCGDKCDVCNNNKKYYKREEVASYDCNEYYYCENCKIETIERLLYESEMKKEMHAIAKLTEIQNGKMATPTLFKSTEACRDYYFSYASYDENFNLPKTSHQKGTCKLCNSLMWLYKKESPPVDYMVETLFEYFYCKNCKLIINEQYMHEYN